MYGGRAWRGGLDPGGGMCRGTACKLRVGRIQGSEACFAAYRLGGGTYTDVLGQGLSAGGRACRLGAGLGKGLGYEWGGAEAGGRTYMGCSLYDGERA